MKKVLFIFITVGIFIFNIPTYGQVPQSELEMIYDSKNIFPDVGKRLTKTQIEEVKLKIASGEILYKTPIMKFNRMEYSQKIVNDIQIKNETKLGQKRKYFLRKDEIHVFEKNIDDQILKSNKKVFFDKNGGLDSINSDMKFIRSMSPQSSNLPQAWRISNNFLHDNARNQRDCGSCATFCAVSIMEVMYAMKRNLNVDTVDISEQMILNCTNNDCDGGWPSTALNYADWADSNTFGPLPREVQCRYTASDNTCNTNKPRTFSANAYGSINTSINTIKQNLRSKGALAVVILTNDDFGDYWGESSVINLQTEEWFGNHCVSIVGWDNSRSACLVRNSCCDAWGINGYGWISYRSKIFYVDYVKMD